HEVDGYVIHDSAHVLGLIAGKVFPNPLDQGADVMTTSTHKTFPGPQGGAVLTNSEELFRKIQKSIFPTFTSNYHQHRYAALAITSLEMMLFGEEYARQIVKNAKKLAEALYNYGLKVLAENKGFTKTHQVLIDVSDRGGGSKNALLLEKANIIVNKNLLPWDKDPVNPSGVRIGVQEVTRLGMREHDMEEIAKFISDVILERKSPEEVKRKVVEFRREFAEVKYGFDLKSFDLENAVKLLI
ncbi:MAG: serine hydroxymethyltransferase, partial [Thermoprotei archaeon ex4572_64]